MLKLNISSSVYTKRSTGTSQILNLACTENPVRYWIQSCTNPVIYWIQSDIESSQFLNSVLCLFQYYTESRHINLTSNKDMQSNDRSMHLIIPSFHSGPICFSVVSCKLPLSNVYINRMFTRKQKVEVYI